MDKLPTIRGALPYRFKRAIHAIDSTTIAVVANCIDRAKPRRRKAAAKVHFILPPRYPDEPSYLAIGLISKNHWTAVFTERM